MDDGKFLSTPALSLPNEPWLNLRAGSGPANLPLVLVWVVKIVHGLRPFSEARNDLLQICQQLAELGNPNAGALKNIILGYAADGQFWLNTPYR